jgi:hypothetical protein
MEDVKGGIGIVASIIGIILFLCIIIAGVYVIFFNKDQKDIKGKKMSLKTPPKPPPFNPKKHNLFDDYCD